MKKHYQKGNCHAYPSRFDSTVLVGYIDSLADQPRAFTIETSLIPDLIAALQEIMANKEKQK